MPDPNLDDERDEEFEVYLKQFRPLAVKPLPMENPSQTSRRRFVFAAWATAAAAVIFIAAALAFHARNGQAHPSDAAGSLASGERLSDLQPLTIGGANALLAHAPSLEMALDRVPFHPQITQLPKDKQSALAVLSQDNDKP